MEKSTRPPNPPERDGDTDQRILEAARSEFAAHGLAGGRVDRIASTAGVNKAMLYYHFRSKENLYMEAVADVITRAAHTVSSLVDREQSLEELLLLIADFYEKLFQANPEYRAIFLRELATPDSPVLKEMGERFAVSGLPEKLFTRLTAAMEAGDVRVVDIRQSLLSFILMNVGYYLMAPVVNRILDIEDQKTFTKLRKPAVVDLFLNGMRSHS